MASFNKLPGFVEHLAKGVHNFATAGDGGNQLKVALSNTAPGSEATPPTDANDSSKCVLANVTQVTYTNLSARDLTIATSAQASGTYKLTINDLTLTSTGGSTGPFRYVYIFNDSATSPAKALVGYYDYGASITLQSGDSFTIDFDGTNGVLTLT